MNNNETTYYSRQILLPEIGSAGQDLLGQSRVLVIGAGGLGSPVLEYLCRAGIGNLGLIDHDVVNESNLHRQVLYTAEHIGRLKVEVATEYLQKVNPFIKITAYSDQLNPKNVLDIISDYDYIVDCSDNYPTRYLVNDACVIGSKPLIYGAIHRFEGQVAVFNYQKGPTYRCLFPSYPSEASDTNCSKTGVIGHIPGIIGLLQSNEVIKLILGIGDNLSGYVLTFNTLTLQMIKVKLNKLNDFDYEAILLNDTLVHDFYNRMCDSNFQEIHSSDLSWILNEHQDIALIDVREIDEDPEWSAPNLYRKPLSISNFEGIPDSNVLIVFCKSGTRSRKACSIISTKSNRQKIYNLQGGISEELIELWKRRHQ